MCYTFWHFWDRFREGILKTILVSYTPYWVCLCKHTQKSFLCLVFCPDVVCWALHWDEAIELFPIDWSQRCLWSLWYFRCFSFYLRTLSLRQEILQWLKQLNTIRRIYSFKQNLSIWLGANSGPSYWDFRMFLNCGIINIQRHFSFPKMVMFYKCSDSSWFAQKC